MSIKIMNIGTYDIPFRPVLFQYFTIVFFIFYKRYMDKTSHCEA